MLIDLGYVVVDVFGYKYYIHSCLSPSVWIWTKSTSMRGCWVASQYGPHLLVTLARLGHIEKQPSILACRLIFKNIPLGCPRGIFSHIHPSVEIQECISNNIDRIKILWSGKSSLCPDWPERTWDGSRSWHASAASNCPGLTNRVWWRKMDTANISTSNYHKYCMVYWLETHSSFGFDFKVDLDIPGMLSLSGYYDSSPCRWRLQRGASACSAQLLLSAWEKKAMNGELGPELGAALCQT